MSALCAEMNDFIRKPSSLFVFLKTPRFYHIALQLHLLRIQIFKKSFFLKLLCKDNLWLYAHNHSTEKTIKYNYDMSDGREG